MNTIETIRAEVERLKEEHKEPTFRGDEYEEGGLNGYQLALDKVLAKLDTLQEKSEKPINPKPMMIEWTGNNLKEVIEFTGKSPRFDEWFKTWDEYESYVHSHGNILKLFNEDGTHLEVPVGAWIFKTPDGKNVPSVFTFKQPVCDGFEGEFAKFSNDVDAEHPFPICVDEFKDFARHFYELGQQSLKDKDTFDEVDDAILELVIRAVRERKDEDTGYENHYDRLLNWLGELPNWVRCKPKVSEDLEEEINRCIYKPFFDLDGVAVKGATYYLTVEDVADIARHFAQWQKEQMMKEAVEARVFNVIPNRAVVMYDAYYPNGIPTNDRGVMGKLIFVKED